MSLVVTQVANYLHSPSPLKNGVISQICGVIDPFFKGHGDSRYLLTWPNMQEDGIMPRCQLISTFRGPPCCHPSGVQRYCCLYLCIHSALTYLPYGSTDSTVLMLTQPCFDDGFNPRELRYDCHSGDPYDYQMCRSHFCIF